MPFAVLYEINQTGSCFALFEDFESAKNKFMSIQQDLLSLKVEFLSVYTAFECVENYRILTHKNLILEYEMSFIIPDFSLYIVKARAGFKPSYLKRNQNYFYYGKSQFIERSIELILN